VDGIPILRISAGTVRKDGIIAEEEHRLISGVSLPERAQYELRPRDLLACRFNGNLRFVGKLSLYIGYLGIKPIYPDKLIRLRLALPFVLPELIRWFADSDPMRNEIESYCATTVGNWGISASNLKQIRIPLPPLAEQHRIVAKSMCSWPSATNSKQNLQPLKPNAAVSLKPSFRKPLLQPQAKQHDHFRLH